MGFRRKIVERTDFEGLDGVFIVGGGEDDLRDIVETRQHFEAGHFRHLNVEEDHVRREFRDQIQCLRAVVRFACDLDFRVSQKQAAQFLARDAFVVDNQGFHAGMETMAATVEASRFSRRSVARSP
jgi:hypothetical protein